MKEMIINGCVLDDDQKQIALAEDKKILVIAPAGAGKSLTIIGRIRYLVESKKIDCNKILCISFTNEATNSLKRKLKDYYNYDIDVKTFHKLAMCILNNKDFTIASDLLLEQLIETFFDSIIYSFPDLMKLVLKYYKKKYWPWNYDKVYDSLDKKKIIKTIITFIRLYKTNGYKKEYFYDIYNYKNRYILPLIFTTYILYEEELESTGQIDLDDLIIKATEEVASSNIDYDYIIVDEYQDTSIIRYKLLKNIVDKTNADLMCVGDDFQSIYNFSGCTPELFLDFNSYFPNSKLMYIKNTYRNVQELIDVAGSFIMKNKRQLKKELISNKHDPKPFVLIYYKNIKDDFSKLILELSNKGSLLILGRNNFDIYRYLDKDQFKLEDDGNIIYKERIIARFLSVHKSKGLESDNVVIINLENNVYGFPNQIIDEEILSSVLNKDNSIKYAEERRLFYVAITRSKNKVYFYCNKNESIFIKELKRDYKKKLF